MTITQLGLQGLQRVLTGKGSQGIAFNCMIKFYSNDCSLCAEVKEVYHQIAKKHSSPSTAFFVHNVHEGLMAKVAAKKNDLSFSQAILNFNIVEDILKGLNDLNPEYKKMFNVDVHYGLTPLFLKVETGLLPDVSHISLFLESDCFDPENPDRYLRNPTTQDFEDFFQDKNSKKVLTIK